MSKTIYRALLRLTAPEEFADRDERDNIDERAEQVK